MGVAWRKGQKGPRFGWSKTHLVGDKGKTLCGKKIPQNPEDARYDWRYGEQCERCRKISGRAW